MHKSRSVTALVDAVALVILAAETALVAVIARRVRGVCAGG